MSAHPLSVLLALAPLPDPLIGYEEIVRWDDGVLEQLLTAGLLVQAGEATSILCGGCDDHEAVAWEVNANDPNLIGYTCTRHGSWHHAPRAWTQRYRFDYQALANLVGSGLGAHQEPEVIEHGQAYRWERLSIDGTPHTVVVARGLHARGGEHLWPKLSLTPTAIVLAIGPKPVVPVTLSKADTGHLHLTLWSILDLTDDGAVMVDRERLDQEVAALRDERPVRRKPTSTDLRKATQLRTIIKELCRQMTSAKSALLDGHASTAEEMCRTFTQARLATWAGFSDATMSRAMEKGSAEAAIIKGLLEVTEDLELLRGWTAPSG